MNHSDLCEIVSIESLKTRCELIQQSARNYFEGQDKSKEKFPTDAQIRFARMNKEELPEHEKTIVHLHFWEGMTLLEISEFIGIPYSLVKSLLSEAIQRLRLNYLIEFTQPKPTQTKSKGVLELVS